MEQSCKNKNIDSDDVLQESSKRPKAATQQPSSILDICAGKLATVFEGDILVVYGPAHATNISPSKAEILHADLVDKNGQMTITLNMSNTFVHKFASTVVAGCGLRITGFTVKEKTKYERGDAPCSSSANATTTMENIPAVCKTRRLTPDMTIEQLLHSNVTFSVGSFAAIVTGIHHINDLFTLYVKDSKTETGIATVHLGNFHVPMCHTIRDAIAAGNIPLLLFKNFIRQGIQGSRIVRAGHSSFIDPLNDESTKTFLQSLINTNREITGTLRTKNIYLPPFQAFCVECDRLTEPDPNELKQISLCATCNTSKPYKYKHFLHCSLQTTDASLHCTLREPLLQKTFPLLCQTQYEEYQQDISKTVFLLRQFQIKGTFTLTVDNSISTIKET